MQMIAWVIALAATAILSGSTDAQASSTEISSPVTIDTGDGSTAVVFKKESATEVVGKQTKVGRRNPGPIAPTVRLPTLVGDSNGALCWKLSERIARAVYEADVAYQRWEKVAKSYPRCAASSGDNAADAEKVVIGVLERFPLPAPRPSIAPGRAITGLRAFLEPNLEAVSASGQPIYVGSRATPLGEVAIEATGTYMVDWGDVQTGPHRGPGGPWPDGNISHVWTQMGTYDVVVTVEWDVRWRMGTESGVLSAHTEGAIPAFPVNQVQAVLHY